MEESLLHPPIEIDNITFLQVLGRGGMSTVYKARQNDLDRLVAIKVLDRLAFSDENALLRFREEAKLTSQFDHPNIVKTLGFGMAAQGNPYLCMEFIDGYSLNDLLKEKQRLTLLEFQNIFLPILSALTEATKLNLVHRDIKPGNIMITRLPDGSLFPKLVDFGIAKILQEDQKTNYTRTGALLGTPAYMSPEQCQGLELDERSDIYSLACVMYEALSGEAPYTANSALEVMHKHSHSPAPQRSDLSAKIQLDRVLAELIVSALAKDPAKRPRTSAQFQNDLQKALSHLTLEKLPAPKTTGGKSKRSDIAIFVSLVAVTILFLAFIFWKRENDKKHHISIAEISTSNSLDGQSTGTLKVQAVRSEKMADYKSALDSYQKVISLQEKNKFKNKDLALSKLQAARCIEKLLNMNSADKLYDKDRTLAQLGVTYTQTARQIAEERKDKELYYQSVLNELDSTAHLDSGADILCKLAIDAKNYLGRCDRRTFDIQTKVVRIIALKGATDRARLILKDVAACNYAKDTFQGISYQSSLAIVAAKEKNQKESLLLINKVIAQMNAPACPLTEKERVTIYEYAIQPTLMELGKRDVLLSALNLELKRTEYEKLPEQGGSLSHILAGHYFELGNVDQTTYFEKKALAYEQLYLYTVDMIGKYKVLIAKYSNSGPAYAKAVQEYKRELQKLQQQQDKPKLDNMYKFLKG